jgi:hypothetical protein
MVSTNTFRLLRVPPMLGRDFVPADEVPGAPAVVILNYRFWAGRLGKRPDIVGLNVHINGDPATIIGVMPPGFDFPAEFSFWLPLARTGELLRRGSVPGGVGFLAFGRLRTGVTLQQARTELETINRNLEIVSPATKRDVVPVVQNWSHFFSCVVRVTDCMRKSRQSQPRANDRAVEGFFNQDCAWREPSPDDAPRFDRRHRASCGSWNRCMVDSQMERAHVGCSHGVPLSRAGLHN